MLLELSLIVYILNLFIILKKFYKIYYINKFVDYFGNYQKTNRYGFYYNEFIFFKFLFIVNFFFYSVIILCFNILSNYVFFFENSIYNVQFVYFYVYLSTCIYFLYYIFFYFFLMKYIVIKYLIQLFWFHIFLNLWLINIISCSIYFYCCYVFLLFIIFNILVFKLFKVNFNKKTSIFFDNQFVQKSNINIDFIKKKI